MTMLGSRICTWMTAQGVRRTGLGTLSTAAVATSSPAVLQTAVRYFNLKNHELERRRARELEKAGINPDDDAPWIAPEEEERLKVEDDQRKAEEAERVKEMLERRAAADVEKRAAFKEFRAKQIQMSKQRKSENAQRKEAHRNSREIEEAEQPEAAETATPKP